MVMLRILNFLPFNDLLFKLTMVDL